eukprot:15278-Heterococcus_DN1.PRE.2
MLLLLVAPLTRSSDKCSHDTSTAVSTSTTGSAAGAEPSMLFNAALYVLASCELAASAAVSSQLQYAAAYCVCSTRQQDTMQLVKQLLLSCTHRTALQWPHTVYFTLRTIVYIPTWMPAGLSHNSNATQLLPLRAAAAATPRLHPAAT